MNDFESFYKDEKEINLNNLYSSLVECFSVILCGYAAGKLNLISTRETKGLDVFVRSFSLPSVIFMTLAQLDLSSVNWNFLASILVSKSIVFIGVIIVTLCVTQPINLGKLGLYAVFCTQSNDFALGYPILYALYGQQHPNYPAYVYLLAPISLAILNPIAYILLEIENFRKEESDSIQNDSRNENLEAKNLVRNRSSSHHEDNLQKINLKKKKSAIKLFSLVFKNIITNPVMCMTFLGMIGNSFYQRIKFVGIVLNAFAVVFSTTALFVLGLKMVGSVYKLKGSTLITSGLLIITKLLVLPLVTREVVSLLHPGTNSSETLDLSTFGFVYGTFPTAPMVFVLATQYNLEIESVSNSLVACTFISAPLMYISAKMIFMKYLPTDNYLQKLQSFGFNLGLIGIPLGVWLIILFIANRAFNKVPHKITGFLIISQIIICIGMILQHFVDEYKPWTAYVQFYVLAFGIYSSRLWTCFLAVNMVILQSRSLCFAIKLTPIFMCSAWGITSVLVSAMCFASFPQYSFESLMNPNFHRGKFQTITTLLVLLISFVGTALCLILQHHYYRRSKKYLSLVEETNASDLQVINETRNGGNFGNAINTTRKKNVVTDIEEIVSDSDININCGDCEDEGLCSSKFSCTEDQREFCEQAVKEYKDHAVNENMDEDHQDHQILRHIVLLLCLVTSMFVNLMLSIWTVVVEDAISGIYVELLFLNVILNSGQIFLTFGVFGFDSNNVIALFFKKIRKLYYGAENIVLPPVDELGFETTHVCHQFIAHHLKNCEKEIAVNKRLKLRMYKDCFKGRTLVMWLQAKRLAKDEGEAIQYASHLLEGRVLRHVESRHHFENSNLLYTFKNLTRFRNFLCISFGLFRKHESKFLSGFFGILPRVGLKINKQWPTCHYPPVLQFTGSLIPMLIAENIGETFGNWGKELQYFGRMTKEVQDPKKMNAVIMGRKTWESLPKSWQPLPGRINFVLSTQTLDLKGAAIHCRNYNDVIMKLNDPEFINKIETAWIIGGSKVYEDAVKLNLCQRIYLTKIMKEFECDTFLNIDFSSGFKEISDQRVPKEVQEENAIQYTFHVYEKLQ